MMQTLRNVLARRMMDERGFTLVELLMAMVIIGVLAGLGFTGFNSLQKRTARTQADVYWRDLNTAVRMHQVEGFGFPSDVEALISKDYLDETKPWAEGESERVNLTSEGSGSGEVPESGIGWALGGADGAQNVCVWVNGVSSGLNSDGCPEGPGD